MKLPIATAFIPKENSSSALCKPVMKFIWGKGYKLCENKSKWSCLRIKRNHSIWKKIDILFHSICHWNQRNFPFHPQLLDVFFFLIVIHWKFGFSISFFFHEYSLTFHCLFCPFLFVVNCFIVSFITGVIKLRNSILGVLLILNVIWLALFTTMYIVYFEPGVLNTFKRSLSCIDWKWKSLSN